MHRFVTPGSTITRVFYSVPEHYTGGPEFDTWDAALLHAQKRRAERIASLTETLAGFATADEIAQTADVQIRVDLRWTIQLPTGTTIETVIESFKNVNTLRASTTPAAEPGPARQARSPIDGMEAARRLIAEQGNRYTVVVEEGDTPDSDEIVWTTQYIRDTYSSMGSPQDAALDVLATNGEVFVDNGQIWRVLVWAGHHADRNTEPVYVFTDAIRKEEIAKFERQEARRRSGFQG